MSVIFSDNGIVWPKFWPQCKYKSTWHIFHDLVILLNIFKIIWWMNIIIGIMDQYVTYFDLIKYMKVSDLYFMAQQFCFISWRLFDGQMLYFDNGSVWLKDRPCKIYVGQWPIFHGPFILPYIIVIDLNYFYNQEMAPAGGIRAPPGTCSSLLETKFSSLLLLGLLSRFFWDGLVLFQFIDVCKICQKYYAF